MSSAMTSVYRLELDCGSGPYNSKHGYGDDPRCRCREYVMSGTRSDLLSAHQGDMMRPAPHLDRIPGYIFPESQVFGFESMTAALTWFEGWFERLERKGFRLSEYVVPEEDVMRGGRQLMFEMERATLTERFSVAAFEAVAA